VHELDALGLARSQKLDYAQVHQRYFQKVQSKLCPVGLELLLQFLDVLRLKAANQTDRCLAVLEILFDFQCLLALSNLLWRNHCKPVANTNT
jgi:hypothetical protein